MGLHSFVLGGGSRKMAVALLGVHTPSKNSPQISGMQAYMAYLRGSIFSEVELPLSPLLRTRVNTHRAWCGRTRNYGICPPRSIQEA
jgi:hypothetical protein